MKNKLSHSAVRMYTECPRKYKFHYVDRLRSKYTHGALLFGSAIDHALNSLLENKNLEEAKASFDKSFRYQPINNVPTYLPNATNVVYSLKDFDVDLLNKEDVEQYAKQANIEGVDITKEYVSEELKRLQEKKKKEGFDSLSYDEKRLYNLANWLSLRRKGHVMLDSYYKKVLPKIKNVLAVQKRSKLVNADGDELVYIIDLIIELEDGKRYLMDHKTSSMEYEPDSAMRSQQLVLYYHAEKEENKLDGVGFIVLYKNILKNKVKTCLTCGFDGSGARHKTCPNEIWDERTDKNVRCGGEWDEVISPECWIDIIINNVPEQSENLVLETFDEANEGIKKNVFNPNLNACGSKDFLCSFYKKCWTGSENDLIDLNKEKKDE